jgi:hypothetical protein
MLSHVPDKEGTFGPAAVVEVFNSVIQSEFGQDYLDWQAQLGSDLNINVNPSTKQITVPFNRAEVTANELRQLVVHELGVHMLRAVMGEETDLPILRFGLPHAGSLEESLGKVLEQAQNGRYETPNPQFPLIVGMMLYDGMDFRDAYETMWRYKTLSADTIPTTPEEIRTKQDQAYKSVLRITRGTDTLPWFKDLSYYYDQQAVWQHLESIRGDDLMLQFLMLGKTDPTNPAHRRVQLETRTV